MKKKSLSLMMGMVVLGVVGASGWVPARIADEDKTLGADDIRQVIKDIGAKAEESKDDEGKTYFIVTTKDDDKFLLFQYGGKGDVSTSISVSAPFKSDDGLDKVNTWNRDTRYTKAYVTEDKTVVLEADLDVSVAPSKAVLQKFLKMFSKAVADYSKT